MYQVALKSAKASQAEICSSAPAQACNHKPQDDVTKVLSFHFKDRSTLKTKLHTQSTTVSSPLLCPYSYREYSVNFYCRSDIETIQSAKAFL